MILEWLVQLAAGLWEFFGSLVPAWEIPAELTDPGGLVEQVVATATGIGTLIDWGTLTALALIPLAVWVIGLLWRAFRDIPFVP